MDFSRKDRQFKKDLRLIKWQLGRKPRGQWEVTRRCAKNHPLVILTQPLVNEEPFPTLYYLTCPFLVKEVSRLEGKGLINVLQKLFDSDSKLRKTLSQTQVRYIEQRSMLLPNAEKNKLDPVILQTLNECGIGGVRNLSKIKCLHAHLAYFLVTEDNLVGMIVYRRIRGGARQNDGFQYVDRVKSRFCPATPEIPGLLAADDGAQPTAFSVLGCASHRREDSRHFLSTEAHPYAGQG